MGLHFNFRSVAVFNFLQLLLDRSCIRMCSVFQGPLIFVVHIMLVKETRYAVARYLSKRGKFCRCVAVSEGSHLKYMSDGGTHTRASLRHEHPCTRYIVRTLKADSALSSQNFIRPPPPATETNVHHGSSTKSTGVASSDHSSSTPQTPLELNFVNANPLGASNRNKQST